MMKIINRIYNWFKKIILNIMGVIIYMNNNEVEIMKAKCEMAKYVIEKTIEGFDHVFGSRKNRAIMGMIGMTLGAGLLASAYVKLPEDEGATDDEN